MAKKKSKKQNLILEEIFLVKADWSRTFFGVIRREVDEFGNPVVIGKVTINEGKIWSKDSNQKNLMRNMDDICRMKLDHSLHLIAAVKTNMLVEDLFLN